MMTTRYFSLLELMVVVALVALTGGLMGVKGYQAMQRQRFASEVDALASRLSLAQQIMICEGNGATLTINEEGEVTLTTETPLSEKFARIAQRPLVLKHIDEILFNGDSAPFSLSFTWGSGGRLPQGNLALSSHRGETKVIPLPGRLAKIGVRNQAEEVERVKEPPYPSTLSPA